MLRGADVEIFTPPIHKHFFPPQTGKDWASQGFNVIYSPLKGGVFLYWVWFSFSIVLKCLPLKWLLQWRTWPLALVKYLGILFPSRWEGPPDKTPGLISIWVIASCRLEMSPSVSWAWDPRSHSQSWLPGVPSEAGEQLVHSSPEVDAFQWQVQRFHLAEYKF